MLVKIAHRYLYTSYYVIWSLHASSLYWKKKKNMLESSSSTMVQDLFNFSARRLRNTSVEKTKWSCTIIIKDNWSNPGSMTRVYEFGLSDFFFQYGLSTYSICQTDLDFYYIVRRSKMLGYYFKNGYQQHSS